MSEISATARRELVQALAKRYRGATVHQKHQILDEFVAVTGYHRKHAIRLLNRRRVWGRPATGRRRRVYDEAVRQALVVLWEASDRVCGKRLKALLPVLVSALERHGHLRLDAEVRERLLRVSASTIDRVLAEPRSGNGRRRTRRTSGPRIRGSVPVRTFADWKDPAPAVREAFARPTPTGYSRFYCVRLLEALAELLEHVPAPLDASVRSVVLDVCRMAIVRPGYWRVVAKAAEVAQRLDDPDLNTEIRRLAADLGALGALGIADPLEIEAIRRAVSPRSDFRVPRPR